MPGGVIALGASAGSKRQSSRKGSGEFFPPLVSPRVTLGIFLMGEGEITSSAFGIGQWGRAGMRMEFP